MTRAQDCILNLLHSNIGDNIKSVAAFASYIHDVMDDTNETAYISDEEVAAIALVNGYKVYFTHEGHFCSDDYLIIDPKYDLADGIKAWTEIFRYEEYEVKDFKPMTLEQLFK